MYNCEDIEPEVDIMDMDVGLSESYESYSDDFNDEPFFEMATVRWGFMSIKLAIYGKEGSYPHFHFYKNLKPEGGIPEAIAKTTGGCIAIESANYFKHGNHTETLDRKEVEGLIKFLKERNKSVSSFNNWQYIIMQWNDNNPTQKQLPLDLDIPDYRSDMDTIQEKDKGNK